jgi:hypothetical protein
MGCGCLRPIDSTSLTLLRDDDGIGAPKVETAFKATVAKMRAVEIIVGGKDKD